ncbi:hypothetical protein [Pseudoalteromonas sp. G4]|uniref:hypothetical protein n=1 Tax=Pseudoalteromonas sp. G4 TaxID=2992761 RepID=UPI00237E7901|nr:hypothetical protein [Pseudoalteromonas sp. G4]MDE3272751.1 hypothetical protein [Pseudoalteromonas sp. G4]
MDQKEQQNLFCFREEAARLLLLCNTQLALSVTQSDGDILSLSTVFQDLAAICNQLENEKSTSSKLDDLHQQIQHSVNNGVMAFQFYDRLTQQLSHIQQTMDQLSHLIQDSENLADEDKWHALRTHLKNSYSMESEHQIYDAIMEGKTKQQALEIYHHIEQQQGDDDIELF